METVMHSPWKISVHAKAKNFDLKFTASKILPNSWEFLETRFSLFIKFHSFLLRLRSETGGGGGDTSVASQTRRRGNKSSLKSKFLTLFDRLNTVVDNDAEDFVEKRRRGRRRRRFTQYFKSEFLISLLEKFRFKRRGVRNKPPGNKIPIGYSSENGFPEMPQQLRPWDILRYYYKEALMMMTIMSSLLVLIYAIVLLMKKS